MDLKCREKTVDTVIKYMINREWVDDVNRGRKFQLWKLAGPTTSGLKRGKPALRLSHFLSSG